MSKAMNIAEELMNILPEGFFLTNCTKDMIQLQSSSKSDQLLFFSNGDFSFSLAINESMSEGEQYKTMKDVASVVKVICAENSLKKYLRIVFMTEKDFPRIRKGYYVHLADLDLYAVPYLIFKEGIRVQINSKLARIFRLTVKEVFDQAYENLKVHASIKEINSVCLDLISGKDTTADYMWDDPKHSTCEDSMLIISNKEGFMGAASIIHSDVQNRLDHLYPHGYYVLPSSKHECLVVDTRKLSSEELKQIVQDVNKNVVQQEDWLSDTIYVVKNHIFEIA